MIMGVDPRHWPGYSQTYFQRHFPIYLVHFVTARCPYRCPTCFYWSKTDQPSIQKELSAAEIARVANHIPYVWQVSLTGGEPFVRSDLDQIIVAYFSRAYALHVSVHTTGCFPRRIIPQIRTVFDKVPGANLSVHFSLDLLPADQDRFRGRTGGYDRFLATYRGLQILQKTEPGLSLVIDTVYSARNQACIENVYHLIRDELRPDDMSLIFVRGNPRDPALTHVDPAAYRDWAGKWQIQSPTPRYSHKLARIMKAEIANDIQKIATDNRKKPQRCSAGQKIVVLNEYGEVLPCEMLSNFTEKLTVMGAVRDYDYSLPNLMAAEAAQKVRATIREIRCACTYECALLANHLTNPAKLIRMGLKSL